MRNFLIKATTLIALTLSVSQVTAQNSHWILAPNYYNNQPLPLPIPTYYFDTPALGLSSLTEDYQGQASEYASNMMVKPNGEIEFFIVDGQIYDKSGHIIDELYSHQEAEVAKGSSEIMIIPFPGDCQKYYILSTVVGDLYSKTPYLFVLDMGLNNKFADQALHPENYFGQLVPYYVTQSNDEYYSHSIDDITGGIYDYTDPSPGKKSNVFFGATKEKSDGSRLAFVTNGYGIFIFNVTTSGFNFSHVIPLPNGNFNPYNIRSEFEVAELSSGNYRIAAPFLSSLTGTYQGLFTAELTPSGVVVPNSVKEFYTDYYSQGGVSLSSKFRGVEFSEDGNMLYVTSTTNAISPNSLFYYDFLNPTSSLNPITLPSPLNQDLFQYSQIERGPLNKLFLATGNGLYTLNNMNNPSSSIVLSSSFTYNQNHEGEPLPNTLGMYSLPDQIDGMDYVNLYEINLACCIDSRNYQIKKHNAISGTWNGSSPIAPGSSSITIKEELRIPAGVSLTINNMTLEFAPGARLVIENGTSGSQGGKLILNGTTLTVDDRCDTNTMWLGVEVWGNTTAAQGSVLNSSQGVFRMYNNSKIEHAEIGVLISRRNETNGVPISTSYNGNFNGGVFIAENSSFYNCWIGTMFQSYGVAATNLSRISSCNYTWNGQLRDLTKTPHVHLGIVQCNKIYVTATKFNQNTPSIYTNKNKWGIGILALNSDFAVSSSCSTILPIGQDCSEANTIRSEFNNLTTGVGVLNGNNKPFTVLRNEFTNCLYGVTSATAKNQKISRNNFFIHEDNAIQTWGISVKNGTGYEIAENKLQSMTGAIDQTYGIIIDNSGEDKNEVYKNFFVDLYVGTQAQNVNGKVYVPGTNNISQGLRYNCNTFKSFIEKADIAVAVNSRIDYEQGRVGGSSINEARNSNTARNEFSYTPLATDIFLSTGSQQVNYYHLANPGHAPLTYTNTPPIAVYPALQTWGSAPLYTDDFTCLTKYPSTWPPIVFSFPFGNSIKIDSLYNLVDGGKSSYLLGLIETQPTSSFTFNELMDASPYLSDTVLTNYIYSKASNNYLKDVLIQNSKLTGVVWDTLKASSRPSGLKDNIAWYQGGVSAMQELYEAIKINEDRLMDAQQVYIYSILDDTTLVSKNDTLVKYLELCRGETYKKQLLNVYSSMQNQTKFDSLLTVITLPKYMKEYYKIVYQLDKKGDWITAIEQDSTILNDLIALSQKDNVEIASNAATILDIYYGNYSNFELLPLVNTPKSLVIHNGNSSEENVEKQSGFMVFPNPSHGTVTVQFSEMDVQTAIVQLVDLSGKELFTQKFTNSKNAELDLSSIKKGTYLLKIEVDGHLTSSQLLILE